MSGVTLKEFSQKRWKNSRGALEVFLEDVWRHYWKNSEEIVGGTLKKILGAMPGATLKELLVELLRNSWRNSGEFSEGTQEELLMELRRYSWGKLKKKLEYLWRNS